MHNERKAKARRGRTAHSSAAAHLAVGVTDARAAPVRSIRKRKRQSAVPAARRALILGSALAPARASADFSDFGIGGRGPGPSAPLGA